MSGLEHAVPERFLNDVNQCNPVGAGIPKPGLPTCPQGISAVRAIQLGGEAGQKIFTITTQVYQNNPNIVSASLSTHSQSTKDRIQQALDVGYEVTIHEAPITQDGWSGAGFAVIDPTTGAGGYTIDGGSNGAWILGFIQGACLGLVLVMATVIAPFVVSGLWLMWVFVAMIVLANILITMATMNQLDAPTAACYFGGFSGGLGVSGLFVLNAWIGRLLAAFGLYASRFIDGTYGGGCIE